MAVFHRVLSNVTVNETGTTLINFAYLRRAYILCTTISYDIDTINFPVLSDYTALCAAANQTRLFATLLFSGPVSYLRCLPNLCYDPLKAPNKSNGRLYRYFGTSEHRISMYKGVRSVRAFKVSFFPTGRFEDEKNS